MKMDEEKRKGEKMRVLAKQSSHCETRYSLVSDEKLSGPNIEFPLRKCEFRELCYGSSSLRLKTAVGSSVSIPSSTLQTCFSSFAQSLVFSDRREIVHNRESAFSQIRFQAEMRSTLFEIGLPCRGDPHILRVMGVILRGCELGGGA